MVRPSSFNLGVAGCTWGCCCCLGCVIVVSIVVVDVVDVVVVFGNDFSYGMFIC